jgi:amino acid transporter
VPAAVLRSAALTFVLYGVPILGILLVLPPSQVGLLDGFIDAIRQVFTVYGGSVAADGTVILTGWGEALGDVAAVAFVLALLSSAGAWIMGADRALAAACFDGAGPPWLGRISRRLGTPTRVNLASGLLATTVMVLAFELAGDNGNRYFSATLNVAISTSIVAYVAVYPAFARLRRTHPGVGRPYRVPGGRAVALVLSTLTTGFIVLAVCELVWPGFGVGWFGSAGDPDAQLREFGFEGERALFELTQIVPLVVLGAVGVAFAMLGRASERVAVPADAATEPAS